VNTWDAEDELDAHRAASLIGAHFPELRDATVEPFAAGWDNTVFRVDGRWAFRFPRRAVAVAGVEREIATLRRLAPHLPIPIPEPRWIGVPDAGYPWPWFGARFLAGRELAAAGVADADRERIGAQLGTFLRALHAPRLAARVGTALPVDPNRRADMAFRVRLTRERLADLVAAGLWRGDEAVDSLLADAEDLPPPPRTVVLHGDLHARHVLVEGRGSATAVSAVIDWGDVCAGDPSVDLGVAYGSLDGGARRAFVDAYGPIDGVTELRARTIAIFLAAALLAYAVDVGLDALAADSLRGLARAVT